MVVSVDGFTAARSQAIEDAAIIGGSVNGFGDLILEKHDGGTINAGSVIGPTGPAGSGLIICTESTRPGSPSEGDMIWETDTNRIYVWPGSNWRWVWSQNGEDKWRKKVNVGTNQDAIGPDTWPNALEISVDIPVWAKEVEAFALLGQAHQVTNPSNTELQLALGAGIIANKRIRWTVIADDNERDIMLMGNRDVTDMNGTTQLLRVVAERVSGTGALRMDSESECYITAKFTDT